MNYTNARSAMQEYRTVGVHAAVESATPHRLIGMLLDGALAKLTAAAGCLDRGAIGKKAEQLSLALSIVGGLRGSLDLERGGEIAANLEALYDYVQRRIVEANAQNDPDAIEEVCKLLSEVKLGWEAIGNAPSQAAAGAGAVKGAGSP